MTVYLREDIKNNTTVAKALEELVKLADESGVVVMTKKEMAEKTGCSPRTVSRWVTKAEEEGYLESVSQPGRLGRTAIRFTDKAIKGAVVVNAVSNTTDNINERLAMSIKKEVHVNTVVPKKKRGKYSPRRSKLELARERQAKMIQGTRNAELNAKVAKLYKTFNDSMSYKFFEDNFENPEERDYEYLVWLVSKMYDAYFKEVTRQLHSLGVTVGMTDGYESLNVVDGYFGTRNHTSFKGLVNSYAEKNQLHNMTMLISNMYSRRYHGILHYLESGGNIKGVNAKGARPFPNNLYLEHTIEDFTKSYDTLLESMEARAKEEGKPFRETPKVTAKILEIIGTDVFDSVPCMLVVNEINNVLGYDEAHNKRLKDVSNEYGDNLKREDTKTIVETFQFLTYRSKSYAEQVGMTEDQLKDYVMYSRYYENVMSYAENLGMSRDHLNQAERMLIDFINYKRFGLDTPVEAYESSLSVLITVGMSDATYKIMHDESLPAQEKQERLTDLYANMLPNDYYEKYKKGSEDSLMYYKFVRAITMMFNFYYDGFNYNQGLAHTLIKSKNERLKRTSNIDDIQEVAHQLQDVLMLNELGLPDWKQINEKLVLEQDDIYSNHPDDEFYHDIMFGEIVDRHAGIID